MEYTHGISIKKIFISDGNWWKFFLLKKGNFRPAIIINVLKMLSCGTQIMGHHLFTCPCCFLQKKVYHTCKSRFCSSCGKKATDKWMQNKFETFPDTTCQHITFTMPEQLWNFFWVNRHLMGLVPALAANIILDIAKTKGVLPGIFLAIHTFGRDLKNNYHIHLSTTAGGLSIFNHDIWIKRVYYDHENIKKQWRYKIITLFRKQYKKGNLKMTPEFKHIKTITAFNKFLNSLYQKDWVVQLNKISANQKQNIEYFGKYIKRPPIGETRILEYKDGKVTFNYLDHYTGETEITTLPVMEFIGKLVSHIPDKNFRSIRYFGFLANRLISKLLGIVKKLVKHVVKTRPRNSNWRSLYIDSFGIDPLKCIKCGTIMLLESISLPIKIPLLDIHELIATGKITTI